MAGQKRMGAKVLEAIGIAAVMVALVQGIFGGDMWGELYFSVGGVVVFVIGRLMEKQSERKNVTMGEGS
jgi:hypothetical protein